MKYDLFTCVLFFGALTTMALPAVAQTTTVETGTPLGAAKELQSSGPVSMNRYLLRITGQNQMQKAKEQLANAKSEAEKQAARESLRTVLNDQFDADIEKRQAELKEIKQRLAVMENHLQKRVSNKEKIVGLRLQVLGNDAEGLGWSQGAAFRSKIRKWNPLPNQSVLTEIEGGGGAEE